MLPLGAEDEVEGTDGAKSSLFGFLALLLLGFFVVLVIVSVAVTSLDCFFFLVVVVFLACLVLLLTALVVVFRLPVVMEGTRALDMEASSVEIDDEDDDMEHLLMACSLLLPDKFNCLVCGTRNDVRM